MKFTYRQLNYIHEAAQKGSIAAAAKSLHISKSSIGAAIDDFEANFDISLFVRLPSKGLNITPPGKSLIKRISHLLDEAVAFNDDLLGLKTEISGELAVGCFAPLTPHVMPSIVRALTIRHANLTLNILEGDLRQVNNMLHTGEAEVILSYDLGLPSGVTFTELCKASPHAIFSESDPLAHEPYVTMEQLAKLPLILLDLPESRTYFKALFLSARQVPNVAIRSGTYETVRGFVASGMGYSILNLRASHNQTYTGARIVCVPISDPLPAPTIGIGTRSTERLNGTAQEFARECQSAFSSARIRELVLCPKVLSK